MKRLVTRSDFDGLVCAMILKECGIIDDIKFVHPKDVQDGIVELSDNDITTNLPYDERVFICFDHHESELIRNEEGKKDNWVIRDDAKSAARVVYNYYKEKGFKLDRITEEIMTAVDKGDSADFTEEEILDPRGWVLMNFLMDARTGLGRFHDFRISNYSLMMELIDFCLEHHNIDDVLALPDVKERVDLYEKEQNAFKAQIEKLIKIDGKVGILDLRNEEVIHAGNRFMIYAMYPEIEISLHLAKNPHNNTVAVMIGKSIINKKSAFDIGELCLKYGGGGHENAGTCQVSPESADKDVKDIVAEINKG